MTPISPSLLDVYLVGVDHRIQWIPATPGAAWLQKIHEFMQYIEDTCLRLHIQLIAEEFSEQCLRQSQAQDSTARRAADEMDLPHLFCDPDSDERQRLAIQTDAGREKEWLRRLTASGKATILFICGDDHMDSFATLLHDSGHHAQTLSRSWGKGWQMID